MMIDFGGENRAVGKSGNLRGGGATDSLVSLLKKKVLLLFLPKSGVEIKVG